MSLLDVPFVRFPSHQPKPKTQLSSTGRLVGGQESTKEIEKGTLFDHEDVKLNKNGETRMWIRSHKRLRVDTYKKLKKIKQERGDP